ncbi:MAG: hypothetical protein FWD17_19825 [Polyangiaceae bacterium]|nr:hypothetical protein [Polyangiaceae bacterium]
MAAVPALGLVAPAAARAAPRAPSEAPPPSDEDALAAARVQFAEALLDEQAGRFADALAKFMGVRAVKDTPAVEYRIASCEEGLAHRARAYAAYAAAARLAVGDPRAQDIVYAATARMRDLAGHVGRLSIDLGRPAPADLDVRVDGAPVPAEALLTPLAVEPGWHVVTASSNGTSPYRSEIALREGADVRLSIPALSAGAPPPLTTPMPAAESPRPTPTARTVGIATLTGGAALVAGAIVLGAIREADVHKLNRACPGGTCPADADRADLESTRSRALVFGPTAIGLGAAGVVAMVAGAYFFVVKPARHDARGVRIVPLIGGSSAGVALSGGFR